MVNTGVVQYLIILANEILLVHFASVEMCRIVVYSTPLQQYTVAEYFYTVVLVKNWTELVYCLMLYCILNRTVHY